jgi:hypothetical protein
MRTWGGECCTECHGSLCDGDAHGLPHERVTCIYRQLPPTEVVRYFILSSTSVDYTRRHALLPCGIEMNTYAFELHKGYSDAENLFVPRCHA